MRFPFLIAILLFIVTAASAQQLGQTKETILAQNGPPIEENHAKNTAVYRKGPWKVDVTYGDDVAKVLTFTKIDPLTESDIRTILSRNALDGDWRELQMGTTTRHWQGSNFAIAQCDRVNPRSIRLTAGTYHSPQRNTPTTPISSTSNAVTLPPIAVVKPSPNFGYTRTTPPANPFAGLFILAGLVIGALKAFTILRKRGGSKASNARTIIPRTTISRPTGPVIPAVPPPLPPARTIEPTLDSISWENFELLAGEIFRRQGFDVEIGSGLGADGGKDLTLRRDGEVRLVQCKLFSAQNKVSVMAMREFYGLMVSEKATGGIFMTTGLYSRDAREFAEGKPIKLLGRAEIEELMASVTRPGENLCNIQDWINDFVAVAHVTNPDCPRCRQPMKLRRGPTGRQFWGCSWYPKTRCRGQREARTELVQAYSYQQS
jgi:hypothetical protein